MSGDEQAGQDTEKSGKGDKSDKKPTGIIKVTSVLASQVKSGVPEWAWRTHGKGRLMRSTLVLFGGRPSAGKSTAARWFASGYSTGTVEGVSSADHRTSPTSSVRSR